MKKIIARLKREPILTRVGLAAVLNVLVVAGVIDTEVSDALEVAIVDLVSAGLVLSARQKVTPTDVLAEAVEVAPKVYLDGKQIADAIGHSRRHAAK